MIKKDWFNCCTLARGNEFCWKYDENGGVIIESGTTRASFSIDDINRVIDHVYKIRDGVPLGARADGSVPENSIGWLLQKRKIPSFNRAWCSYLAAILVSEGICSYEDLGRGPGRGIWVLPATEDICVKFIENLNTDTEHLNEDTLGQIEDLGKFECREFDFTNTFQKIANDLINLSNTITSTNIQERKCYQIKFSELNSGFSDSLRKNIRVWENQHPQSLYIYIYKASKEADLKKINSKYAFSREKNLGKRAFARINKENCNSNVLYVGSSRSIGQRTKDHLGFSSKSVFALQIYYWSREIDGGCELEILRFPSSTDYDVIQSIEDGLWNIHKPMFGRQGQR